LISQRNERNRKRAPVGNSPKELTRARRRYDPGASRKRRQKPLLVVLLGLGGVVLWLWWPTLVGGVEHWLQVKKAFLVTEIVVEGNHWTSRREIVAALHFAPRQLIFDFDIVLARKRIAALPFIKEARLRRSWPDRIEIRVREFRPVALLNLDRLYLVSEEGRVLAPVAAGRPIDYPLITGVSVAELRARPGVWKRLLRQAATLLKVWRRMGHDWPEKIDQVSLDEVCGVTVFTIQPAWELQLGWRDYAPRLDHWRRVLEKLGERSRQVCYFDCVGFDMVVAGLKPQSSHKTDLKVGK